MDKIVQVIKNTYAIYKMENNCLLCSIWTPYETKQYRSWNNLLDKKFKLLMNFNFNNATRF